MRDGEVCCWLGKFIEARAYFEAALASWDPGFRDRITSPHDVYVNALIYLSRALFASIDLTPSIAHSPYQAWRSA